MIIITEEKANQIKKELTEYVLNEINSFIEQVKVGDYSNAEEDWDFKIEFQDWLAYKLEA